MKLDRTARGAVLGVVGTAVLGAVVLIGATARGSRDVAPSAPPPVLSVELVRAEVEILPLQVPASGAVAAWQEAIVSAESNAQPLLEVRVDVGDTVRRGDVLARFDPAVAEAELAEAQATVAQAAAALAEAEANAQRARGMDRHGALSAQQIDQYLIAAKTAAARLDAARAVQRRSHLRLTRTQVLAPSDGIVAARTATLGAVVPSGQELFRLIRDGRLEWRAAVAAADLEKLAPGQSATLELPGQTPIEGRLRLLAPVVDAQTRSGLAHVDLPRDSALRPGLFARGHFRIGAGPALTLPQSAVLLRDGFSYVMRLDGRSAVLLQKVETGRRVGARIEIVAGLAASDAVIAAGLNFLAAGDRVRVVPGAAGGAAAATAAGNAP